MPRHYRNPSSRKKPNKDELDRLTKLYGESNNAAAELHALSLTQRYPDHGFGWKVLGLLYEKQDRLEDALRATRRAIALLPDDASTYNNLGAALFKLDRPIEAEASFKKALAIVPAYANARSNLGALLHKADRKQEAELHFKTALTVEPNNARANFHLGELLFSSSRLAEAETYLRRSVSTTPDSAPPLTALLFCLSHHVSVEAHQLLDEHLAFGEQFEARLRADWQPHANSKDPTRTLQVGFVSGDLYDHAVASFLEPVLKFLAPKHTLILHAYYTHTLEDAVTQRLRTYFPHWHAVASLSDVDLANKIRADDIDILFDLSGHTARNRLLTFARKPAPIQVSWIGYPGTTGLQAMDYRICDRFWLPPGEFDWLFTEKLAYLPCGSIFQPSEHAPPVNTLPALENGYVTFGSFNRSNKLNESVIVLWSMLLQAVPTARMVLGGISPDSQTNLIQTFTQAGIEQSRLTFFPRSTISQYLALHLQVDICLDTFPYNGGTTTDHASWMGVPTLTLAGETPPSRSGARLMALFGLDEFVATSIEDFVSKGLYWAEHLTELSAIRSELRTRFEASDRGQPETFVDKLDVLLRMMWQRWCNDLPPASIEVKKKN